MFKLLLFTLVLSLHVEAKTISRTQIIMSTYINITLEKEDEKFLEKGFDIFKEVDASLSSFNKNSKIYKLNSTLHVALDEYSYEALMLSKKYYEKTDGYFDVSIGSITKDLYRFGLDERVPTLFELSSAKIDLSSLHVEKFKAKIHKGMKIDLGGMGKGFGVDKVVEIGRASCRERV